MAFQAGRFQGFSQRLALGGHLGPLFGRQPPLVAEPPGPATTRPAPGQFLLEIGRVGRRPGRRAAPPVDPATAATGAVIFQLLLQGFGAAAATARRRRPTVRPVRFAIPTRLVRLARASGLRRRPRGPQASSSAACQRGRADSASAKAATQLSSAAARCSATFSCSCRWVASCSQCRSRSECCVTRFCTPASGVPLRLARTGGCAARRHLLVHQRPQRVARRTQIGKAEDSTTIPGANRRRNARPNSRLLPEVKRPPVRDQPTANQIWVAFRGSKSRAMRQPNRPWLRGFGCFRSGFCRPVTGAAGDGRAGEACPPTPAAELPWATPAG